MIIKSYNKAMIMLIYELSHDEVMILSYDKFMIT